MKEVFKAISSDPEICLAFLKHQRATNKLYFSYGFCEFFIGCLPEEVKSVVWHYRKLYKVNFVSCAMETVNPEILKIYLQDWAPAFFVT